MKEISVLIGGKAGDGINQSGLVIARLLSRLGYFVYMYFDYPSLIRGGHNFAIVRASFNKILSHRDAVDYILAMNQDTVDTHAYRLKEKSNIIFDSNVVKSEGVGLALAEIVKEENALPIMRNSSLVGAFAKCAGIDWKILDEVMRRGAAKYRCTVCGYIYDPEKGDPDNGIAAGTPFEGLPDDWVCPECGVGKDRFEKV